jgi:hypothetical protein
MIALRSRHFRKRTPDLRNSARFNTIPALRGVKMNPVLKKNFAVFPVLDWIATLAAHIPDKGEQLLRYYGYYSNVSRGKRKKLYRGPIYCGSAKEACIEGMRPATAGGKSDKSTYLVHWKFSDSGRITTVTLTEAVMTEYLLGTGVSAHTLYFTPFSSPVSLVAVNRSEPND